MHKQFENRKWAHISIWLMWKSVLLSVEVGLFWPVVLIVDWISHDYILYYPLYWRRRRPAEFGQCSTILPGSFYQYKHIWQPQIIWGCTYKFVSNVVSNLSKAMHQQEDPHGTRVFKSICSIWGSSWGHFVHQFRFAIECVLKMELSPFMAS